jgi:hypothetical protein
VREVVGDGRPGDERVAVVVDGDRCARVVELAEEVRRVHECGAVRVDLGHEGVRAGLETEAVSGLRLEDAGGGREVLGIGLAGHVGVAVRIDREILETVVPRSAEIGRPEEVRGVGGDLRHEARHLHGTAVPASPGSG